MKASEAVANYGSNRAAARALGVDPNTIRNRLAKEKATAAVKIPTIKNRNVPIATVIKRLAQGVANDDANARDRKWFRVHVNDAKPIGLMWFGDPHLGTHTAWDTLSKHVALCATTPGMYGANIGDTTNNWVGRLTRLYADEDISRQTERRLAKWFLAESGVTWLAWLMGNHDEWEHGAEILRLMDIHNRVPMLDWEAKFEIVFKGKNKVRVHAAHDFPGNSMWNITHAPARAPRMLGTDADLYVCGHRHDWGIQQFEQTERGKCPLAIRVRGYKKHDPYARRHGYQQAEHGASILTIIDPAASTPGRVTAFVDIEQGVKVLKALRGGK